MRRAGIVPPRHTTQRVVDFLLIQGIRVRVDPDDEGDVLWILEEEKLADGKTLLTEFLNDPDNAKYDAAARDAEKLRREEIKEHRRRAEATINMSARWRRPSGGTPLCFALIVASCVVAFGTKFGDNQNELMSTLLITHIGENDRYVLGLPEIRGGQVWRLVTPMLLHFDVLHLLFNMLWMYQLGCAIESRRGTWRFFFLVIVISAVANLCQYALHDPMFGGMSGVVYGLLGYAWMKTKYDTGSGVYVSPNTVLFMGIWFVACWSPLISRVANWAHLGGLLAGLVIGYAPHMWKTLKKSGQRRS